MTYYTIMEFKRRTCLADTVKVAPALAQPFGVSGLFSHVEHMETSATKSVFHPNFGRKAPAGLKRWRLPVLGIRFFYHKVPEFV